MTESSEVVALAVASLDDLKARDVRVLDVSRLTPITTAKWPFSVSLADDFAARSIRLKL